ncbi:MAG: AbrB family transcriptional regulator [Desulfurococcales archaeon ex4484_217_2]|nr:MAG: AbrB family transcriptional regulator [Desulfurococcales archaeon ex4484_217_2]
MEVVVAVDERGRVLIPGEVRRRLGIRGKSKLLLRVRNDGVIELVPLDKLYKEVSRIFEDKFRDWREESHDASRILMETMR